MAEVEKYAAELVRAAEVRYLDGTTYQGFSPPSATAYVPGGMFEYLTIIRHERIYLVQITLL